jgi:predicted amidohydrolase YtcJ
MTADTILRNGKVLTVDQGFSIAQAVAIKDGLIAAVGSNDAIARWRGGATQEIDLGGKTVIPGIIDGHPHLAVEGLRTVYPSLAGARSIDDVLRVIAAEVAARKPGEWIVTAPLGDPPVYADVPANLAENRFPNRHDLDKVAPNNPVYIKPIWSWWNKPPVVSIANSAALRLAGISRDTPAPYAGITIEKDTAGEPTGVIIEDAPSGMLNAAQDFSLMRVVPRLTFDDRIKAFRHSLKKFNSVGTTSIYEGHGVAAEIMAVYRDYWLRDALTVRSYLVVSPPPQQTIAEYDVFMREWAGRARGTGVGEAMLKTGGINIVWGGDPEVAKLRAHEFPYAGYSDWYVDATTPDQYRDMVLLAARHGLRVNTIASAQASLDAILAIFEEVNATYPIRGKRWVLQHLYELTADNVAAIARLGIVPTILPGFQLWKSGPVRRAATPKERWGNVTPYGSILRAGLPLVTGTDGVPPEPFVALWTLIARRYRLTGEVFNPAECLSREEALRTMTINAAYLSFEERLKGSIEPGKYADLAVLDQDYLSVPQDEIKEITVATTMLGGRIL